MTIERAFVVSKIGILGLSKDTTIVSICRRVWPQLILVTNGQTEFGISLWMIYDCCWLVLNGTSSQKKVNLCQTAGKGKRLRRLRMAIREWSVKKHPSRNLALITCIFSRLSAQYGYIDKGAQYYLAVTHSSTNRARHSPTLLMSNLINSGRHLDLRWMKAHSLSLAT